MKTAIKTYSISREYAPAMAKLMLFGCAALAVFYGWSLYSTISKTVALEEIEKEKAKIEEVVGGLEARYMALAAKITPELARDYGFIETKVSVYINRAVSLGVAANMKAGL